MKNRETDIRKTWILAFSALILTVVGISAAYLTDRSAAMNRIRVGRNTIVVQEDFTPPKKQEIGDNVFKKQVQIENVDETDCFVRVFMEFSDSCIGEIAKISPDGVNWYEASKYKSGENSVLPENWTYISEEEDELLGGYYYYTSPLRAGDMTNPLMNSILVSYTDAMQIQDFDILIAADSVQTWINAESGDGSFTAEDVSDREDGWRTAWTDYMERR